MYLTVLAVAAALYTAHVIRTWQNHYFQAQTIGLPCVVVPGLPMSPIVRILHLALFSLLKCLPKAWAWTPAWLDHLDLISGWHDGYGTYRRLGADAYVLVAPGGLMIVTCAPDAIDEILHRREAFPRPVELFQNIGRYGKNLACSEGEQWRRMRRPVARAFGDKNNREVWRETLYQATSMVRSWTPGESIPLNADTRRISQNVISKAVFGFRMPWSNEPVARGDEDKDEDKETKHGGMSYVDASRGLVRNILLVIGLPELLLRYAPSALLQQAYQYNVAFRAHIRDAIQRGRAQPGGDDVLHALLRRVGTEIETETDYETLSDSDILGNSFQLILGGHETVATSMQLAMIFLALNTQAQKNVQHDIDRIVGQRPPEEWTYNGDLPQLLESWVSAVMQEGLRLVPPVPFVLIRAAGNQTATFDGVPTPIPSGTFVSLSQLDAHRNPKYWPHKPSANSQGQENDLEEFRPERWFVSSIDEKPQMPNKKRSSFRPQRGVYFPFSEGTRACVGRRFAQIEYTTALAVIFHSYSIELDVREWVSDADLDRMAPAERDAVWQRAAKRTRDTIRNDMNLIMTMHLKQQTSFPIRLVERDHEHFR